MWGGKRKGAGRKPSPFTESQIVMLTPENKSFLKGKAVSKMFNKILDEIRLKEGK